MGNPALYEFRKRYAYPGEIATTILEPKPSEVRLGVGLDPKRKSVNPSDWKDAIGTKRVSARFELLPHGKPRWDRIGLSAAGQSAILAFLLFIPLIFPQEMKTALKFDVVELMQPVTEIPLVPPPLPPPPRIKVKVPPPEPKPVVPEPVKLNPRQPHIFMAPKPEPPMVRKVEAKPVELNRAFDQAKIDVPTNQPKRPKDEVKVGNLSSGSAVPATEKLPVEKVQTGGFGEINGLPGKGDPNKMTNVNRQGLPALPGGPGYGNGSGGAKTMRGTVAEAPNKKALATGGATTPVDILDKPNPAYTAEGRTLRIEGDVVLELVFLASGQVQVNRVVNSLGHGLDEAAIQAAKQIRFKPAKHDGQPVDFPARVRIAFRLAS